MLSSSSMSNSHSSSQGSDKMKKQAKRDVSTKNRMFKGKSMVNIVKPLVEYSS